MMSPVPGRPRSAIMKVLPVTALAPNSSRRRPVVAVPGERSADYLTATTRRVLTSMTSWWSVGYQ